MKIFAIYGTSNNQIYTCTLLDHTYESLPQYVSASTADLLIASASAAIP